MSSGEIEIGHARERGYRDVAIPTDVEIVRAGESEWLIAVPPFGPRYAPTEHKELPSQFARLADPQVDPLPFLKTYGLLGWQAIVDSGARFAQLSDGWHLFDRSWRTRVLRELKLLPAWREAPDWDAEPLDWVRTHAGTIRWCLQAGQALQEPDRRRRVRALKGARASAPAAIGLRAYVSRDWKDWLDVQFLDLRDGEAPVEEMLRLVLDINVSGVRRGVEWSGEALRSVWGGVSLLDAIYVLTLEAVAGQGTLAECSSCRSVFVRTDGRQRFCPPRSGQAKSTCMNRLRLARYRESVRKRKDRSAKGERGR